MSRMLSGLALLALAAQPAAAQAISGRVVESRSGWSVPHATVTVVDAGGRVVGHSQSDGNGGYHVDLRAPGRYVIRAERVGYRGRASASIDVPEGREVVRDIRMTRRSGNLGQDAERGLVPGTGGIPAPIPAVPPSTNAGPSTSAAPSGDAARPEPRVAPAVTPRRSGERRPAQPRPAARPSGGARDGTKRTP